MEPTQAFLESYEVGRMRRGAEHGPLRAVVEYFCNEAHPSGIANIYASFDGGVTFSQLDWKVSWWSRWKTLGRDWPPHNANIEKLDDENLHISFYEITYDGSDDYKARYSFTEKLWRL